MSLKDRQQAEYDRLMKMKAKDWPSGLKTLWLDHQLKADNWLDATASAVREWVQKEVKLPVSNFAEKRNTEGERWEASTWQGAPGSPART